MTLTIAIVSDFICPWCLVAEKRLSKAMQRGLGGFPHERLHQEAIEQLDTDLEIKQIWYPYELNPTMPEAGIERKAYRTTKFGSWEYSQQLDAQTIQATKNDGIDFRYDLMKKTPNTLKAHRLTWLAQSQGKATEIATRILEAYFTEGKDITNIDTLAKLAADVGMDESATRIFLQTDAGVKEIRELEQQLANKGIRGVPSITIGTETISGGQPVEVYLAALKNALIQLSTV